MRSNHKEAHHRGYKLFIMCCGIVVMLLKGMYTEISGVIKSAYSLVILSKIYVIVYLCQHVLLLECV